MPTATGYKEQHRSGAKGRNCQGDGVFRSLNRKDKKGTKDKKKGNGNPWLPWFFSLLTLPWFYL